MTHHHTSYTPVLYTPTFSWTGIIAVCLCTLFGMFALQLLGVYLTSLIYHDAQMDIATLITLGSQNGTIAALSVIFTALVLTLISLAFIFFQIKHSHTHQNLDVWRSLWRFFGVKPPTLSGIIISLVSLTIFMVISEIITVIANKSPMDFLEGLVTGQSLLPLTFAVVVVAPIYEELVFRGLIFGVLSHQTHSNITPISLFRHVSIQKNTLMATLISSILFALVHLQYDMFGMVLIFCVALLFCFVRAKYGIITAMLMHMINNGVAMALYLATS